MLKNIAETIDGGVKLSCSLLKVAALGGAVLVGWKAYHAVTDYFSKPAFSLPEMPGFGPKPAEPPPMDYWRFDGPPAPGGPVAPNLEPRKLVV